MQCSDCVVVSDHGCSVVELCENHAMLGELAEALRELLYMECYFAAKSAVNMAECRHTRQWAVLIRYDGE